MRCLLSMCCLLVAVPLFAERALHFEDYVTARIDGEEIGAKVLFKLSPISDEHDDVELTIAIDGEEGEPVIISVSLREEIDDSESRAIYNGEQRIGTATVLDNGPKLKARLEFALLHAGTKVADIDLTMTMVFDLLPTLHLDFKLSGALELSFADTLRVDPVKTFGCKMSDDGVPYDC